MNDDLISRSEVEKLGATCLARRNENGQLEAVISLDNAPTIDVNPYAIVKFDKDELKRIVDERVIEPIKNGELVIKEERPAGKWIKSDVPESMLAKCSLCGFDCGAYSHNFCPNCGADMRGGRE